MYLLYIDNATSVPAEVKESLRPLSLVTVSTLGF